MKFSELIKNVDVKKTIGNLDVQVDNVQIDSNAVNKGSLFVCLSGGVRDGGDFIRQAENYGAVAVVTEKQLDTSLAQVVVVDSRKTLSIIASEFYKNVSKKMRLIAVVGTNGKTTTAHLIGNILNNCGIKCGIIGTLGAFYGDNFIEPDLTTPDPLVLHKILSEMYNSGYKTAVMEVSAHALYYNKIHGIDFEVGVFTNFTRDHLDFFNDMEAYKKAKRSFFEQNKCKYAVVNADDELGVEILSKDDKAVSYGIDNPSDVFAIEIEENDKENKFILNLFDCVFNVNLSLIGRFNVYNALGASTACALLGIKPKAVVKSLQKFGCVSGRCECVYSGDFSVYIDYAHTPDGLKNIVSVLKGRAKNRLICVFGCGGNRDIGKRREMGAISGEYSDFTVITSDNPRYEEPMDIIRDIEGGVLEKTKKYVIIQERTEGISYALNMAKSGDVILIAGKGSENYQEILGIKRPYNDKDTVEELLRSKRN